MAIGKKTGGKDFQKGNPIKGGRPELPIEIKEIKKLTTEKYIELVNKFIHADCDEITRIIADPKATMLEKYVAAIIEKGVKNGDTWKLGFLLDRIIGPVKQKTDITSGDKPVKSGTIIYLPHNGKEIIKDE